MTWDQRYYPAYNYPEPLPRPGRWIDAHFISDQANISDADVDRIARRVVELLKEKTP